MNQKTKFRKKQIEFRFQTELRRKKIQLIDGNQGLDIFFKFSYIFLLVTILLLIWMSLTRAQRLSPYKLMEVEEDPVAPCHFTSLCKCSGSSIDLGVVLCRDVLLTSIPQHINQSKVRFESLLFSSSKFKNIEKK